MEQCKIVNMYDLNETIAKEYMETAEYPWELLDGLSDYIKRLGATLDQLRKTVNKNVSGGCDDINIWGKGEITK